MKRMLNGVEIEMTQAEIDALESFRQVKERAELPTRHLVLRERERLPIEIRLNAIWKQLNYMQMNGQTNLIEEMDAYVQHELALIRKYPKPKQ